MSDKKPAVSIAVMQGAYRDLLALDIDGKRHGPDAGPWTTIAEFRVDADELIRVAEKAKSK